jgi:DNA-binding response OmpR family regulator
MRAVTKNTARVFRIAASSLDADICPRPPVHTAAVTFCDIRLSTKLVEFGHQFSKGQKRMTARILVVASEPELADILRTSVESASYQLLTSGSVDEAIELVRSDPPPDLVLLEVDTPLGYEICRRIRADALEPAIFAVVSRDCELDRVSALDLGANDVLSRPIHVLELLARIRANLRRKLNNGSTPATGPELRFGDITVDVGRRHVRRGTHPVSLSSTEFDLLVYFMRHQGELVSRDQLLRAVWRYDTDAATRTVDNFVAKLRRHVDDPDDPKHILTVHGAGYRFIASSDA